MQNKSNVFWGAILIVLGIVFLGTVNDWFNIDISFREIAKYWPLMIVLAGISVLFDKRKSVYNPTTALLIAFAIPLGLYNASHNVVKDFKEEINDELNFDWDDNNDDDNDDKSNSDTLSNKDVFKQDFSVELNPEVKESSLEIGGGAAEFHLEEAKSNNLFEARTELTGSKFKLEDERKGDKHEVVFSMNSKNGRSFKFGKNNSNDVYLRINKKPIWEIDLNIGAGDMQFDLSEFKVKKINVKTGAANLNLKLGSLIENAKVKVESGVAKISIKVPKESGCEIELDGALNTKDFNGFKKLGNGKWRSEDYERSKNKISIVLESGLSAVSVDRY